MPFSRPMRAAVLVWVDRPKPASSDQQQAEDSLPEPKSKNVQQVVTPPAEISASPDPGCISPAIPAGDDSDDLACLLDAEFALQDTHGGSPSSGQQPDDSSRLGDAAAQQDGCQPSKPKAARKPRKRRASSSAGQPSAAINDGHPEQNHLKDCGIPDGTVAVLAAVTSNGDTTGQAAMPASPADAFRAGSCPLG